MAAEFKFEMAQAIARKILAHPEKCPHLIQAAMDFTTTQNQEYWQEIRNVSRWEFHSISWKQIKTAIDAGEIEDL